MKKKVFAVVLTMALVASQSVCALAAGSTTSRPSTGGSKPVTSTGTITAGTGAVAGTTADGQSLTTNGAGSKTENVKAEFATGTSATAGLPEATVASINSINSGAKVSDAVGNAALEGYSALTKTSAIVLVDTTTGNAANQAASVTLYIPNLMNGLQNVKILYFENATSQWKVVDPTAVDYTNKTITFNMSGSGTVAVIYK